MAQQVYIPKNGEIWDERLWYVTPTHMDPQNPSRLFAQKDGRWFLMEWSPGSGGYVGLEITNKVVINRLKPIK